jgi:tagatose 1,6-diphosphate aldolase
MSYGKLWSMRRLADDHGVFRMLAVDQRPPIQAIIAKARGCAPTEAPFEDMKAVKRLLVETLAPHATATLVDPNFAYPGAIDALDPRTGLIMTLEEHKFVETPTGRRSGSIPHWTVEKIKKLGADGVKVLAWYRPDASAEVRAHQKAYVASVGRACLDLDIPFVFELLVYPFPGTAQHTTAYIEDQQKHPAFVIDSVKEFADPIYGVDIFKLESPIPAAQLPDPKGPGGDDARSAFKAMADATGGKPWVMLSAGAGMAEFARVMGYAYGAGASGYLAGRAIWLSSMAAYPNIAQCRAALEQEAIPYMRELTRACVAHATPWRADYASLLEFRAEGDFARSRP